MRIIVNSKIKIDNIVNPAMVESIKVALTVPNPKHQEAVKIGRYAGNIPQYLKYYDLEPDGSLTLPRGFTGQLISMCRKNKEPFVWDDQRRVLPEVDFKFKGILKPFQREAVDDMLKKDFGTLCSSTGSGKTVMSLALIAHRKQPTLIIVHTKELLNQWRDRIETFLGIPKSEIGMIGNGKFRIGGKITVGMVQTLAKRASEVVKSIGNVIVDETHRLPGHTMAGVVSQFDSKYMTGLSATPYRRDGLSNVIFWTIGDIHHTVDKAELVTQGHILKAEVVTRETEFRTTFDPSAEYSKMISELTKDEERNDLIASDVAEQVKNGEGICLVLSDRKGHCEALQTALNENHGIESELLTGDVTTKKRKAIVDKLNGGQVKVLIATGQLIGEGFDMGGLSILFLATPVRFSGRVLQYLGRVLRPAKGKEKAMVFDYVDIHIGPLVASAKSRQKAYRGEIQ